MRRLMLRPPSRCFAAGHCGRKYSNSPRPPFTLLHIHNRALDWLKLVFAQVEARVMVWFPLCGIGCGIAALRFLADNMLATTASTEPRRVKLTRRSSTNSGDMGLLAEESGVSRTDDSSALDGTITTAAAMSLAGVTPLRNAPRLVPIIPPHEILPGTMDVDMDRSRLGTSMYLCERNMQRGGLITYVFRFVGTQCTWRR